MISPTSLSSIPQSPIPPTGTPRNPQFLFPSPSLFPRTVRWSEGERLALRPREIDPATGLPITPSAWARRYRYLPYKGDRIRWEASRSPYAAFPMDYWARPSVREVYLCFAPQIVKTEISFNCAFFAAHQSPGPMIFVTADEDLAKRASIRINNSIRVSPALSSLLARPEDLQNSGFRLKNGASLMVAWATSLAKIASDPAEYAFCDEASKWPDYSGSADKKESSPFDLVRQRQNSYTYTKKLMALSSPGAAPCLISRLQRYEADEAWRYEALCPVCGAHQVMVDDNIVALRNIRDPRHIKLEKLGRYACAACGMYWDDYLRNVAVLKGRWACGRFDDDGAWHSADPMPHPRAGAFHLPAWYNLALSLSEIAADKVDQDDDPRKKMFYVTQRKAEEYSETVDQKSGAQIIALRTHLPAGIVPAAALALTCGIDSHTWGYRFTVYAWTEDEHGFDATKILHGHLGSLADVRRLVFESRYHVENSRETLGIWRAAIDTGGGTRAESDKSITDAVYNFLREIEEDVLRGLLPDTRIYGVKGASGSQVSRIKISTIDKLPHSGKPIPGGLELRIIDTAVLKLMLHTRIAPREKDAPARIHFDGDTGDDFARELLAEDLRRKLNGRQEWTKTRQNNHYLDATIYAMAAADPEWQPSLKILAPDIKQVRERNRRNAERMAHGAERVGKRANPVPPSGTSPSPPAVRGQAQSPALERYQERIDDIRSRLAARVGR